MSKQVTKRDFHTMNVAELKKYLQERGVSVSGYLISLIEIAAAVEGMMLPVDPNFEKDKTNDADNLLIHDMLISNPFSMKTVDNFNSSPPFGLYDIFNYLIYHSIEYDKQGLAACTGAGPCGKQPIWFEQVCLFDVSLSSSLTSYTFKHLSN